MKPNQKQFYANLIECARETYVRTYNLAIDGDFCKNKEALRKLDAKIFECYLKIKRPKKLFKILVYTASTIYNNELIVNASLCYNLNILNYVCKLRLYRVHKFIQFVENKGYMQCLVPGMKYSYLNALVKNILRGVEC